MKRYRVKPDERVDLSARDAGDRSAFVGGKEEGHAELARLVGRLEELQELLYAEHAHKVLLVLQGMDTAGKDGVIRHVFEGVNPQGVRVASFKVPTAAELDRDYLWRVHREVPGRGEIAIFNRSHYEDVLVVRVHGLVPPEECERRYAQINDFERMLVEEGTSVLKLFLHVSKAEQRKRLQERLDDPRKHWKFSAADVKERERWADYVRAYEEMLGRTSTEHAPWNVVPADTKWYRNLIAGRLLVGLLEDLNMRYPAPAIDLASIRID